MSSKLLILFGIINIIVAVWGLISGKIIAGSRGLSSNYYYKDESPKRFYSFVFIYLTIGVFILYQSLH
jgi:hypothetical protein